jgi:hypothetical protein
MEEIWNILNRHQLTANQFHLLWSMKEEMGTPHMNVSLELRNLKNKGGWVLENGKPSPKALKLVKEIEGFLKVRKKKTNKAIMGNDFEEKMKAYNNLWPKKRLPSGKAARSAIRNLESGFRWLFENYEITWEQIYEATNYYLDDREKVNWEYTMTSQYFVRKQRTDKSWHSELADVCQLIEDGGDAPDEGHFTEKVF